MCLTPLLQITVKLEHRVCVGRRTIRIPNAAGWGKPGGADM